MLHLIARAASAILLFSSLPVVSQDTSPAQSTATSSLVFNGLSGARSEYYRNLMIQDISLPQQIPAESVGFRLDIVVNYEVRKNGASQHQIKINSVAVTCDTVKYFGFDISSAVKPHFSTLSFKIKNSLGFIEDSVFFSDVPVGTDPSLYVSKSFQTVSRNPHVEFSSARLIFDEKAYETFRDEIALLDDYFAAAAILDSLMVWSDNHFPSGDGSVWGNYLQQLEIGRILSYIDHSPILMAVENKGLDPANAREKLENARRKKLRAETILHRQVDEELDGITRKPLTYWTDRYFEWITGYEDLANAADHRFGQYYSGLSGLRIDNGLMVHQFKLLRKILAHADENFHLPGTVYLLPRIFKKLYIEEASERILAGDIVSAVDLLENAHKLQGKVPGMDKGIDLEKEIDALKYELASFYLSLARMAAGKNNSSMSEGYLEMAGKIFEEMVAGEESSSMIAHVEQELYRQYFEQARALISQEEYRRAYQNLVYLQTKCSMGKLDCTGEMKTLSRIALAGMYEQLLVKAIHRMQMDDWEECKASLDEAVNLRKASIFSINRDKREAEVALWLDQQVYDEDILEGVRYLHYGEHDIALYFFNKALLLENTTRIRKNEELIGFLRQASKPVVMERIEAGRARARGFFFEEGWEIVAECREMIKRFDLYSDAEVAGAIDDLVELLKLSQCEKFGQDYHQFLQQSEDRKEAGDYLQALDLVNEAIRMVLDDTICDVNDQEAWLARAVLEYPAEFAKKEKRALSFMPSEPESLIKYYHELQEYYMTMELEENGVVFVPLHIRVMQENDLPFLQSMMEYYFRLRDREKTVDVMKRMWMLHGYSPPAWLQKELAGWLAGLDMKSGCPDPLICLNSYAPADRSFKTFRRNYKWSWVTKSGLKIRYLSLFLKNKSGDE